MHWIKKSNAFEIKVIRRRYPTFLQSIIKDDEEIEELEYPKRKNIQIPPATVSSPYPVIIDHTGRPWHSNKALESMSDLQRDRLPYAPTLKPDGTYVTWRAYLGPGQSMLRRRPSTGQVPHFEEDDERWNAYYEKLVAFKAEHGHLMLNKYESSNESKDTYVEDDDDDDDEIKLGPWCNRQRYQYRLYEANNYSQYDPITKKRVAYISEYRIKNLKDLGFDFRLFHYKWEDRYEQLKMFYDKYGHSDLKGGDIDDFDEGLYFWIKLQRMERKKLERINENIYNQTTVNTMTTTLTEDRIQLLDELELDWDPRESAWDRNFEKLKEFKVKHGHMKVPNKIDKKSDSTLYKLGQWMNRQREVYRMINNNEESIDESMDTSSLTSERIEKLNSIEFDWNPLDTLWNIRYEEMKAFEKENGHCNVPIDYPPNPSLGIWTSLQRKYYHNMKEQVTNETYMTPERIKKLEKIGFAFRYADMKWEYQYNELIQYKNEHGDCNVPRIYPSNSKLGNWVHWQRRQYKYHEMNKKSSMTKERIQKLETLGFQWSTRSKSKKKKTDWDTKFDLLCQYKKKYGDCDVSMKEIKEDDKFSSLSSWIPLQRKQHKLYMKTKSKLQEERMKKLESIGFVWNTKEALWKKRLKELKDYKEKYGNCNVPKTYAINKKLGQWVSVQRVQYKKMKKGESSSSMTNERIALLEDLDFQWSLI